MARSFRRGGLETAAELNVLLWLLTNPGRLPWGVRQVLEDDGNVLFVSWATIWELSIKVAKGRLAMPGSTIRSLLEEVERLRMVLLPIEIKHILRTETLPHHHGDPFNRMIVPQALKQELAILTDDDKIPLYAARVIWR